MVAKVLVNTILEYFKNKPISSIQYVEFCLYTDEIALSHQPSGKGIK